MRSLTQMFLAGIMLAAATLSGCAPQQGAGNSTQQSSIYVPSKAGAASTPQNAAIPTRTVRVALLVPMTGRNADLGRAMQDAATLALYDKYAVLSPTQAATRVEILPKDSGDTPEMARAAAQEAIADGAQLILGPIFADAVVAVAPVAQAAGVQMISFSNNASVARAGVYVFGFSPDQQTDRIVSHALSQKMRVAALVPNSQLGQQVLATAKARAAANGAQISPVSTYLQGGLGVDKAADALVPAGDVSAKSFDTLFVPEVGAPLDTVLRTLAARGINNSNTQLIGTGLWDDTSVVREHNLDGALLASSPPNLTQGFLTRFRSSYNYVPPRIASLSYDAVALAVTLATSGRGFDQATLTGTGGFSGPANGIFRFKASGLSERGLAVLRIRNGQFEVVSPAPSMFR